MDRGAWPAIVHGVAKSQSLLMQLSTHTCDRDYMAHGLKCLLSDHLQKKFVLLQLIAVLLGREVRLGELYG